MIFFRPVWGVKYLKHSTLKNPCVVVEYPSCSVSWWYLHFTSFYTIPNLSLVLQFLFLTAFWDTWQIWQPATMRTCFWLNGSTYWPSLSMVAGCGNPSRAPKWHYQNTHVSRWNACKTAKVVTQSILFPIDLGTSWDNPPVSTNRMNFPQSNLQVVAPYCSDISTNNNKAHCII